jgi:hypothetical protein
MTTATARQVILGPEYGSDPPSIVAFGNCNRAEGAARSTGSRHRAAQTPTSSTIATSVVAISSVRKKKLAGSIAGGKLGRNAMAADQ